MSEKYEEYLNKKGLTEKEYHYHIAMLRDFEEFILAEGLTGLEYAGKEQVTKYAKKLIEEGRNTPDNYVILWDYAYHLGYRRLFVALIEVVDCHDALEFLADVISKRYGEEIHKSIFTDMLPPLGVDEKERWECTKAIIDRMSALLPAEESLDAWYEVAHGLPSDFWEEKDAADRNLMKECKSIDDYLERKLQERNSMLTKMHDQNKLWHTIEITDEVYNFVMNDPHMETGKREGNKIFITKIPYNASAYLKETDEKMKRYYACHCALAREAIRNGEPVPPEVCYCSLGHASHFLAGLGIKLKGEVLESAAKGDTRCRFVFYLPESYSI